MSDPYLEAAAERRGFQYGYLNWDRTPEPMKAMFRAQVIEIVEAWVGDRTLYRWIGEQPGGNWVDTDEMLAELIADGVIEVAEVLTDE